MPEQVKLRDGTDAWVMSLELSDKERLVAGFEELSPESRRQRFLAPVNRLSESMLEHLVDEVDGVDHVALVLFAEGPPDVYDPVAIARIVRYSDLPDAADLAVTVKDDWHGRGVATALLPVVLRHRPEGVTRIVTEVASDNPASLAMLRRLGPTTVSNTSPGVWDVEVDVTVDELPELPEPLPLSVLPPEALPGGRLHAVLDDPRRLALRSRDLLCPWLDREWPSGARHNGDQSGGAHESLLAGDQGGQADGGEGGQGVDQQHGDALDQDERVE
jgi:RimJ/RimL family protein N-acetyltransferase